jgi:hypothetical protein
LYEICSPIYWDIQSQAKLALAPIVIFSQGDMQHFNCCGQFFSLFYPIIGDALLPGNAIE